MKNKISAINSISIKDHTEYSGNVIITRYTVKKNFRLHRHSYYELEYIVNGEGREILNGIDTLLSAGSLRLISPSDVHELIIDGELSIIKICFDSANLSPSVFNRAKAFLDGAAFKVEGVEKETFDALFETAVRVKELFLDEIAFEPAAKSLLETVILTSSEYLRRHSSDSEPIKKGTIGEVLQYLHSSFDGRQTLSSVAQKFHFTPSYLSRRFHEVVGTTFVKYIKNLRLEYAARLLHTTDAEITEICYEAGFSSPSGFTNDFRKCYGLSPTKYRASKNDKTK
jgi:AraC-like DNA-binding protein